MGLLGLDTVASTSMYSCAIVVCSVCYVLLSASQRLKKCLEKGAALPLVGKDMSVELL